MGTGLGGESYAIIGQERIGQLLSRQTARSPLASSKRLPASLASRRKSGWPNCVSKPPSRISPALTTSSTK